MRIGNCLTSLQALAMAGMLIQSACSGGGSSSGSGNAGTTATAGSVSVAIVGVPSVVPSGSTLSVTAQVVGSTSTAVTWTVDDIPNGNATVGTIAGSGDTVTYTAPTNQGSHVMTAAWVSDPTKSASASFSVQNLSNISSVTVSPSTLSLNTSAQNQFTATVSGTGSYSSAVTWSAQRGKITSAGLYTAPSTGSSDVVTATSVQDTTKTVTATITLTIPSGSSPSSSISTVAVSPSTLTLNQGTQSQFTATVSGTGSYSQAVTWSALYGSITSAGLYTAPSTSGSDVVTATSVQTPSVIATASVTVNPFVAQGPPVAPTLSGPTEVQVNSGPYTATVTLGTGLSAQWTITGGTLVGATNGSTVQFQAGSAPYVTLTCTVTNGTSTATTNRWMVALPFTPRNYLADHKAYLAKYAGAIATEIATGDASVYYATSYYLHGMAAAAEATGDVGVMDTLMGYIAQMMAQAKPLVRNGVTYQEWGPFDPTGGYPGLLNTFQATGPLARTAAIIARNPVFQARYSAQFSAIVAYVDQSIFKYWFDKQTGYYSDPNGQWLGGQIPWLPVALGGWGTYPAQLDTCSHLGMIATWMYQATNSPLYLEYATRVAKGFRTHITVQNGSYIWDKGIVTPAVDPDNLDGSPDTSHANREVMMVESMYEAGIEYTLADVQAVASTWVNIIWNQSESNPLFTNYIDGGNMSYRTASAWQNGVFEHGWDMLGRYSAEVQRVIAISWQDIMTVYPLNYSLSGDNSDSHARVLISGTLARNIDR